MDDDVVVVVVTALDSGSQVDSAVSRGLAAVTEVLTPRVLKRLSKLLVANKSVQPDHMVRLYFSTPKPPSKQAIRFVHICNVNVCFTRGLLAIHTRWVSKNLLRITLFYFQLSLQQSFTTLTWIPTKNSQS